MSVGALEIEGVWKRFRRSGSGSSTLKSRVLERSWSRGPDDWFWALRDVSLDVRRGETVGIVGANGAGKSTLLKLAAGLGKPSRGRVVRGVKTGAVLSLGEAFEPLLTGRENALTAAILARSTRREALRKLDDIASFAELDEAFDQPVRTYSDGMKVRLAFSVAMSVDPELLVVDEVLAVGDMSFQAKCCARLEELQRRGTTILFASHDEQLVRRMCERAVLLAHGGIQVRGTPDEVYDAYGDVMRAETERRAALTPATRDGESAELRLGENRFGTLEVEIATVRIAKPGPGDRNTGLAVEIDLEPQVSVDDPVVGLSLQRVADGARVLDVSTAADGALLGRLDGPRTVTLCLDRLDVQPGLYRFDVGVYERAWNHVYDYHWQAYPVEIGPAGAGGSFGPPRRWSAG